MLLSRFDPSKIDWENLKKVGITADTLKNTKDFDRVMRGYKSRNTYTVSGTVGGFYLKPIDVKLSFYQAKDSAQSNIPSETTPASFAGFKFTNTMTFLPTISSGV